MLKSTLTNPFCLEGESFFRIFEGGLHSTTPFLGVNRWGVAGIGLKFYDEKRSPIFFGGYSFSYKLITLWRALRLLELTRIIENNGSTFAACIGLFQPNKFCAGGDEADIRELADQFGGKSELQKIHAVILESFPKIDELDYLLTWMYERGVRIDVSELMRELWWYQRQCGLVFDLPIIKKIRDANTHLPEPTPKSVCARWRAFWYGLTLRN